VDGNPFITFPGETFAARVGASLLNAVNLPQLIVNSLEEYEKLAVHLATHPQELQKLKDYLNKIAANCRCLIHLKPCDIWN
jgi:predicted O-linked N-acetylglucosamine transferase (SPINDLY family)